MPSHRGLLRVEEFEERAVPSGFRTPDRPHGMAERWDFRRGEHRGPEPRQYESRTADVMVVYVVRVDVAPLDGATSSDAITTPDATQPLAAPRAPEPTAESPPPSVPARAAAGDPAYFAPTAADAPRGALPPPTDSLERPAAPDGGAVRPQAGVPAGTSAIAFVPAAPQEPQAVLPAPEYPAPRVPDIAPEVSPLELDLPPIGPVVGRLAVELAALGDVVRHFLDHVAEIAAEDEQDEHVGYAWYAAGAAVVAWAGHATWAARSRRENRHEVRIG